MISRSGDGCANWRKPVPASGISGCTCCCDEKAGGSTASGSVGCIAQTGLQEASKRSSHESTALARICVHARSLFPQAVAFLMPFLIKTKNFDLPLSELAKSGLAERYPLEALSLLTAIVDEDDPWPAKDLKTCLDQISSTEPTVTSHLGFRRLQEYWARYDRGTETN